MSIPEIIPLEEVDQPRLDGPEDDASPHLDTAQPQVQAIHFSFRAVLVGLFLGGLLCFSNMYFGLQSGWVTFGSLQSTLLGFAIFKGLEKIQFFSKFMHNLTPYENVVIQTTAVASATMPVAGGYSGILPALATLEAEAPFEQNFGQLLLWGLALAFFGVFFAVPLRRQTILREKLKFPSGTATAHMIKILHKIDDRDIIRDDDEPSETFTKTEPQNHFTVSDRDSPILPNTEDAEIIRGDDSVSLENFSSPDPPTSLQTFRGEGAPEEFDEEIYKQQVKYFLISFAASGSFSLVAFFFPVLSNIPIFSWIGLGALTTYGWTLFPSFSYIGQGMIMGLRTGLSMLIGSVLAWGFIGPIADAANLTNEDNHVGQFLLFIALSLMLADSLTGLATISIQYGYYLSQRKKVDVIDPAPLEFQVPNRVWISGLVASSILCIIILWLLADIPIYETFLSVIIAFFVSVLAVRALGETDFNPVSGVGKISQLIFAGVAPGNVVSNIVAGAVAEAGAAQAGDMMQDLKTGHIIQASPKAQFYAQLIGSFVSIPLSAAAYRLYVSAYRIGGPVLPAPSAGIWLSMARLLTGNVGSLSNIIGFCVVAMVCGIALNLASAFAPARIKKWVPSGIAMAIAFYLPPTFILPRVLGSFIQTYWMKKHFQNHEKYMIVVASGFVLGEGVFSILNALLTSAGVPPLTCFGCVEGRCPEICFS